MDVELNKRINELWAQFPGDQVEKIQQKFYGYIATDKPGSFRGLVDEYPLLKDIIKTDPSIILGPVKNYQPEIIELMVTEYGLDMEFPRPGYMNRTLLLEALHLHHRQYRNVGWSIDQKFVSKYKTVDKLLQLGVNVNAVDYLGNSPLHYAISRLELSDMFEDRYNPPLMIVELLLLNGADPNLQNFNGCASLHVALRKNDFPLTELEPLLKMLIRYGANERIVDEKGRTAIALVLERSPLEQTKVTYF